MVKIRFFSCLLFLIFIYQIHALTAVPPVSDTIFYPSIQHLYNQDKYYDAQIQYSLIHYYIRKNIRIFADQAEKIDKVDWLLDSTIIRHGTLPDIYGCVSLDFTHPLNNIQPSQVHNTVRAKVMMKDGTDTLIVWQLRVFPVTFNLFTATVHIDDAIDTVLGDSIFTLSLSNVCELDTLIFTAKSNDCISMKNLKGLISDTADIAQSLTDTLRASPVSTNSRYAENNVYNNIRPFLGAKSILSPCQILCIKYSPKDFKWVIYPLGKVSGEAPIPLDRAYQIYCSVSPVKLQIGPLTLQEIWEKQAITCPLIVTDQNTFSLIARHDGQFWYFDERIIHYQRVTSSSYRYSHQFKIDNSGEVSTVSCNEEYSGFEAKSKGYCSIVPILSQNKENLSFNNNYTITYRKSDHSIGIFYQLEDKPDQIAVYSISGRKCNFQQKSGPSMTEIDMSLPSAGIYVIVINKKLHGKKTEGRFIVPVSR